MSTEPPPAAVWFDFAGVLTAPAIDTFLAFCSSVEVDPTRLLEAFNAVAGEFGTHDFMEPIDTPLTTLADWTSRVSRHLLDDAGVHVDLTDFAARWFTGRPANKEMVDYAVELGSRGVWVGLVSNMVPEFQPYWPQIAPVELFDGIVLSYEVGCRKPDAAIFRRCEQTLSKPHRSVLIDDLPSNCAGAQAAGWSAVVYESAAAAIDAIEGVLRE